MSVDLKGLSPRELQALIDEAKSRMTEIASSHAQESREKLIAQAKELGYDLHDLFGIAKPGRGGKRAAAPQGAPAAKIVKYRHPQNAALTWAGRGKRPRWVNEWLNGGGTLEALLVK